MVLTACYWGIEWVVKYWCVTGIGKLLTAGECILGSCMVRGADPMLLGDCMGREILLGERNWETIECKRIHSE